MAQWMKHRAKLVPAHDDPRQCHTNGQPGTPWADGPALWLQCTRCGAHRQGHLRALWSHVTLCSRQRLCCRDALHGVRALPVK
eukprot:CAMPEP_0174372778 /NCGR_PEP_ID=MMETSP0811_2-20130205/104699_1 /TAXON_ID=73025 ORGANISM="Eutreptiella gymnastica-like, Strain CCMP1594" /NCGR_SAMPLE_ID=MMETSP0811_2 /ASSEMBLY_ACC=CAM_ASM_000667 /LENGTH=82 /DNA_ID=CAMNT_0015520469 /DNA_START=330 /DNA_END=578 /DNA_ORIENTATION=+